MSNYATGYAFNVTELFENFNNKRLSISSSDLKKTVGYQDKDELVLQIFLYAIKVILLDIIQNNVTFKFPTKRECYLNIVRTSGEEFKQARRNGKWLDVDYLKSNFSGNQMQFMFIANEREIKKPVYLSNNLKDIITENTNNGMVYY
jgi:hypothetical protein